MARRWPISIRVWTCGQTSEAGGKNEGHSIRQIHRTPQLRRAGHHPRLGRLEGPARRQPGQLRHPDDRAPLADIPGPHTPRHSRESNHPVELAGPVPSDAWAVRVLSRLPAFFDLLRVRPRGERERHSVGDHQASLPDGGHARPGAHGAAGGDLDRRHDQAAGRQAMEGAAPAGLRRRGRGRGPLLHAREGGRHAAGRVRRRAGGSTRLPTGRPLLAAPIGLSQAPIGPRHNAYARRRRQADGEAEVLVGSTEGRAGLRRDARGTHVPPRAARRPPGCRSTSCPASI